MEGYASLLKGMGPTERELFLEDMTRATRGKGASSSGELPRQQFYRGSSASGAQKGLYDLLEIISAGSPEAAAKIAGLLAADRGRNIRMPGNVRAQNINSIIANAFNKQDGGPTLASARAARAPKSSVAPAKQGRAMKSWGSEFGKQRTRENILAKDARERRAKDLELERMFELKRQQDRANLLKGLIGELSARGRGDRQREQSVQEVLYDNAGAPMAVPLTSTREATSNRSFDINNLLSLIL